MTVHTRFSGAPRSDQPRNALLKQILSRRGFETAFDLSTIEAALTVGDSVLGGGHADPRTVQACEEKTRRCFFVRRDASGEVEGFIALLYLNRAGYLALVDGKFSPVQPRLEHLTDPDEDAAAIYVWCLAGRGEETRRALVRAVTEARRRAFEHIPLFARPVSREGRMMTAALDAPNGPTAWLGWIPQAQAADDRESEASQPVEEGVAADGRI